ncbi:MAG: aminotransferase class III-fold pyridoxal phosphate-dependent enzyme, partial [Candidatus Omnitrophica bacterium]|nr:aminotransferase class III-fold pyridoxal phosphate-dependent enzyme [Candidatus Omnitrophota bacterium]
VDFLKKLSVLTKEHGALLIFDEVITGFRFNYGSFAQRLNIVPDLICLGKIIGGGLPIGAYGANMKIMQQLAPLGKVYQASTFSGNPVVMQAGVSTLKILSGLKNEYLRLKKLTWHLALGFEQEAFLNKVQAKVNHFENIFSFKFKEKKQFEKFYRQVLAQGVFFAPSEFEANFLSFAHSEDDIKKTLNVVRQVLRRL